MKSQIMLGSSAVAPILYTCARDENIAPGTRYGPIVLDLYIIECCTKGSGSVIINGNEIPFKAGDCYIVQPEQRVVYTASQTTSREGVWCALDGPAVAETVKSLGLTSLEPFIPHDRFDDTVRTITALIESKDETDMGAEMRRTGMLFSLLGGLLKGLPSTGKSAYIEKALGFMEANYYKPLNVSDISKEVGLERCYFSTLFKSHMGVSPHAYLTHLRVRKAAVLISEKGYSVTEASEMVGLAPENFARTFRAVTGKSPREIKSRS